MSLLHKKPVRMASDSNEHPQHENLCMVALNEAILMSTHNIGFCGEINKLIIFSEL